MIQRIATCAHEVGHHLLLGERRLDSDYSFHEPLTDMTVAFLGLGVFGANAYLRDATWDDGAAWGWEVSRVGYLDAAEWAYALALFAWFRGETSPQWTRDLRPDVRRPFEAGLRHLADASVPPGTLPTAGSTDVPGSAFRGEE